MMCRHCGKATAWCSDFTELDKDAKTSLAANGVDLLDDLICPFIAKLDRVVERLARDGFDIAIVGTSDNHHCREAKKSRPSTVGFVS